MKWNECAVEDLRKYTGLMASLTNIPQRIAVLEMEFTSIKGNRTDKEPVSGSGANHWENFLINNINERERLKFLLAVNKKMADIIKRGLSALNSEELLVLKHFYIRERQDHIGQISEKLNLERSDVYRLKDKALRKYVLNMYGMSEYLS